MRTIGKRFFLYLIIISIISSCESKLPEGMIVTKDPISYSFSIDKNSIDTKSSASKDSINIKTNGNWKLFTNVPWIIVSPTSGYGNASVLVSINENNTSEARDGDLVFTSIPLDSVIMVHVFQHSNLEKNDHIFVDLSLTSGTLWSSCNIGAENPEESGLYFAWGETIGYKQNSSNYHTFNWNSYKYCKGDKNSLTKYCTNDDYGIEDNKNMLETDDDAARTLWGESWSIPSKEEMEELHNECEWSWTSYKGIFGYLVTSKKNSNSIFLPASGYCVDNHLGSYGEEGFYWTSSVEIYESNKSHYLHFDPTANKLSKEYRFYGFSIRPVCSK